MVALVRNLSGVLAGAAAWLLGAGAPLAGPKIYVGNFKDNTVGHVLDAQLHARPCRRAGGLSGAMAGRRSGPDQNGSGGCVCACATP